MPQAAAPIPPIGSIVAFAGSLEDVPSGWLLCDGRGVDVTGHPELFGAIGANWGGNGNPRFYLPDLRGAFLRGVDHDRSGNPTAPPRDPDRGHRWGFEPPQDPENRGNEKNAVGSFQDGATAIPNNDLTAVAAGAHTHPHIVPGHNTSKGDGGGVSINGHGHPTTASWPLKSAGSHAHDIQGGDAETRPYNAFVYWIIRAK